MTELSAYDRLMQEAIPTRPQKPSTEPWTAAEQAQHVADLLAALDGWHWQDNTRISARRQHLRIVPTNQTPDAA